MFILAALPWIKRFGPWIAVGLVALGVYVAASTIVKDWKKSIHDTAYAEGVKKESDRQDAIARRIEGVLGPRMDQMDARTAQMLAQQTQKETVYVDRIHTQIRNNPQQYTACRVDDSVLADRNALRNTFQASPNPGTGTNIGTTGGTPPANN